MKIKAFVLMVACTLPISGIEAASEMSDFDYCVKSGGVVENMPAEFSTPSGFVRGQKKLFCNFEVNHGFIVIGLETFASETPSIAATYLKTLGPLGDDSSLWEGAYTNPSQNVCKNLGGAAIGFVSDGGFANHLGQSDVCVFGDGSMVSAWSLIYMANHREGYDQIKERVKAEPICILRASKNCDV